MKIYLLFTLLLVPLGTFAKEKLNIATPKEHPYVKPENNREHHRFTKEKVNEFRVYDFYQRQADYYMQLENRPNIIPAYPGLDAGQHGHWGKYNQNSHKDNRWNDIIDDGIIGSHVMFPKETKVGTIEGAIVIPLGKDKKQVAVFYPRNLNFNYLSHNCTGKYDGFRWGTSKGYNLSGPMATKVTEKSFKQGNYNGYYKSNGNFIFSYNIDGSELLDMAKAGSDKSIDRIIQFQNNVENIEIQISQNVKIKTRTGDNITLENGTKLQISSNASYTITHDTKSDSISVSVSKAKKGDSLYISTKPVSAPFNKPDGQDDLAAMVKATKPTLSDQTYKTTGTAASNKLAYVVDDIALPFKNKTNSLMFFTGIDFNDKGEAFISSLKGDVWKVVGLVGDLKEVTWTKIASGLNQPFGLKIRNDVIYVLERTRVTALHDTNKDGEIDFFECINNEIGERPRSHSHKFGLEMDKEGNFYFVADVLVHKVDAKTRKMSTLAKGVRHCIGIGMMTDGSFIIAAQEGTNTPTSSILRVYEGDDYGFKSNPKTPSVPMAYVPRGVDSSTGGFLQVNDNRWGPLGESFIGLSYGYGQWYNILPDSTGNRQQGTVVPMDGEFIAGVVRAAVNPLDGQVYTVGLDGWGDYSVKDGCLHRIRYTGKKMYKPTSYKTYYNGLKIDFPIALEKNYVNNIKKYFAQHWNYLNSRQYGSPEYSISQPSKLGHDILEINSIQVLDGGKSIFVEIPRLQPVMQMHLRMHLKAADGTEFKTDLFSTIIELGETYPFKGALAKVVDKQTLFHLRTKKAANSKLHSESGKKDDHAREITIVTKNLQYDIRTIKAKPGESLLIYLKNDDVMPHNLVITDQGAHVKVGMTSFKMLNNPKAADMHYVPEMKEVLGYTFVIQPKGSHKLYFKAPEKKGTYPFFCSFPGHWRLMTGNIIVE